MCVVASMYNVASYMFLAPCFWRVSGEPVTPTASLLSGQTPSSATRRRQADDIDAPVAHFQSAVYRKSESKWVAHSFAKLDLPSVWLSTLYSLSAVCLFRKSANFNGGASCRVEPLCFWRVGGEHGALGGRPCSRLGRVWGGGEGVRLHNPRRRRRSGAKQTATRETDGDACGDARRRAATRGDDASRPRPPTWGFGRVGELRLDAAPASAVGPARARSASRLGAIRA